MTPTDFHGVSHVFVCYTRADNARIGPILDDLRSAGVNIWQDLDGIDGAAFWRKEIVAAIEACSLVLFFVSRNVRHSENVSKELALANEEHKSIVPIYLDDVKLPAELRYQIAGVQHIVWSGDKANKARALDKIVESIARVDPIARAVRKDDDIGGPDFCAAPSLIPRLKMRTRTWILPGLAILAAATAGVYIFKSQAASVSPRAVPTPDRVRTNTDNTLTPMRDVAKLRNSWYVQTTVTHSEYRPYVGLSIRYHVFVTQNGSELEVRGEKVGEVRSGTAVELVGKAKTPIRLTGHIAVAPGGNSAAITLSGEEGSTSRESFSTIFELQVTSENVLRGIFKSTAANVSGPAVWIAEQQWSSAGWGSAVVP